MKKAPKTTKRILAEVPPEIANLLKSILAAKGMTISEFILNAAKNEINSVKTEKILSK